ncbi:MAG: hypothetical protein U1D55_05805 [Phycisphaerae bacterium]
MTNVPTRPWWQQIEEHNLAQGDYLPSCLVPCFRPDYGASGDVHEVSVRDYDCIVLTQSCDLENDKAPLVALCPVYGILEFENVNPRMTERGMWERVRQGRIEGLHLLASPTSPDQNRFCLVAEFREIYSLPIGYLKRRASELGRRWRLQSPYLEHFSQAFARFFMRVGLPSSIPSFAK